VCEKIRTRYKMCLNRKSSHWPNLTVTLFIYNSMKILLRKIDRHSLKQDIQHLTREPPQGFLSVRLHLLRAKKWREKLVNSSGSSHVSSNPWKLIDINLSHISSIAITDIYITRHRSHHRSITIDRNWSDRTRIICIDCLKHTIDKQIRDPRYSARLRYIAWTCMERVFFILTVRPSEIEMRKHALHASPGVRYNAGRRESLKQITNVKTAYIFFIFITGHIPSINCSILISN
jgi:hypothetical protein